MKLEEDIQELHKGKIDYIHFDVMDGLFVPRYGLFPEIITQIRASSNIPFDLHMMVEKSEEYIDAFVKAGANQPEDVYTIHAESTRHLDRVIRKIKSYGIKAGVALNPSTPLHVLDYVLPEIDMVMIMAINPGVVGHKLIPHILDKILHTQEKLSAYPNIVIAVDGGVSFNSASRMAKAGATMLVCGTQTIYRQESSISIKIKELRDLLYKY